MALSLAQKVAERAPAHCDVVLFPSFPYLESLSRVLQGSSVGLGGQNLCPEQDGAFTGEVSGEMLVDCGCRYVIVGHSERRALYTETDAVVAHKFVRAQEAGLTPVLCVGEELGDRESGATAEVVLRQLDAVIERAGVEALKTAVVAYEPVWAIGTGRTATPGQAQEVHALIRGHVAARNASVGEALPILYGGSVKTDNAAALFSGADVDGALVGGASLDADSFLAICQAATN